MELIFASLVILLFGSNTHFSLGSGWNCWQPFLSPTKVSSGSGRWGWPVDLTRVCSEATVVIRSAAAGALFRRNLLDIFLRPVRDWNRRENQGSLCPARWKLKSKLEKCHDSGEPEPRIQILTFRVELWVSGAGRNVRHGGQNTRAEDKKYWLPKFTLSSVLEFSRNIHENKNIFLLNNEDVPVCV